MPTRFYLHSVTNYLTGTFPTSSTSVAGAPTWSTIGATTIRMMDPTIGLSMVNLGGTSAAATTIQKGLYAMFTSPPLIGDQTVGGGIWTFNAADSESNLAGNAWWSMFNAYVWRPSTGAKVGVIRDTGTQSGGLEPTATTIQVSTFATGTSAVAALDGDVLILEAWTSHVQANATARNLRFYFDGTTVTTVENTVVTNHAAFIDVSEDLSLSPQDTMMGMGFFGH